MVGGLSFAKDSVVLFVANFSLFFPNTSMVHGKISDKGEINHLSQQKAQTYLDTTMFKKSENARNKLKTNVNS
jgi:hypothetical protein